MGHSYKDLIVWQKAVAMVTDVYRATQTFPKDETYGRSSQLGRSAVSLAGNIAEGQGRLSKCADTDLVGVDRTTVIRLGLRKLD